MERFFRGEGIIIDLTAVSCVTETSAIVDGVTIKIRESVAFDLRKQLVAYKVQIDADENTFRKIIQQKMTFISSVAHLIGERLHLKNVKRQQGEIINGN